MSGRTGGSPASRRFRGEPITLPRPLTAVTLLRRLNRFAVEATAAGRRIRLYLPNSGRMEELLRPGVRGLAHLTSGSRRTRGTLLLVRHRGRWVGVDARTPNRLFEEGVRQRALAPFRRYTRWSREVRIGSNRIDFVLEQGGRCLVETKSCNRVDEGVALFPDAPTTRGVRHLEALAEAALRGDRAAMVWFVQRDDAVLLRPYAEADPAFAAAVARAASSGVELYAYTCRVTPRAITVLAPIPVVP